MKKGKLLATLLCSASMVMGSLVPTVPAMADAMKVVTLGADLSDEQKNTMLKYFKVDSSQAQIIYVTNQDERDHLSSYVPLEQIGTRTVSRLVRHAGVLRALRERRGSQACAADPYTVPVRAAASDDGVSAEQRKYPDAAPGLLVPVVLRAARASFEHKRSHLIPALSAYFTGFSGCGRPDDGLARPVEQA